MSVRGLSLKRTFLPIYMKFYYSFFLLCGLAMSHAFAQLPEPLVLDTLPPKPTIEEKLKAKSRDLEEVRKYVDNLLFRSEISTVDRSVYPSVITFYPASVNSSALSAYDQLLSASRVSGDRRKESEALSGFGDFYALQGDLGKSVEFYREALQIRENLKNNAEVAKASFRLASVLKFKRDYQDAQTYYEYSASAASVIKHHALQASAYAEIGKIKVAQNKFEEAEHLFMKRALPLYTRIGNKQGRILCFENLAQLYLQQKRYSEAKWFFIQANLLGKKINNEGAVISSLINLGHVKNALGDLKLALQDYQEAEKLASLKNDVPKLIEIKSDLGDLYHKMGNFEAADKLIQEYSELRDTLMNTGK